MKAISPPSYPLTIRHIANSTQNRKQRLLFREGMVIQDKYIEYFVNHHHEYGDIQHNILSKKWLV